MDVRVRFAPSPTGPLHIGGVRTALYNYLFAKKNHGTFILRIEDTDQNRYVDGAEQYIIESLEWLGLKPDEGPGIGGDFGPYRQSERSEIYWEYVQKLLANGWAYYAFDTPAELEEMRERRVEAGVHSPKYDQSVRMEMKNSLVLTESEVHELLESGVSYTVRLKVPENEKVSFTDEIRGDVEFDTNELDDKVLIKADGLPTYHFANVVDDHLMQISHVIRGEEWLSSTGHHVLLYRAFGWEDSMPRFAHLPLILKPTGKGKLSKRDGAKFGFPVFPLTWADKDESFPGFRDMGYLPEAVINFLAFLGWNPGTEQEIFSLAELASAFSLDRISKGGARFDIDKAGWYNGQYIQSAGPELDAYVTSVLGRESIPVEAEWLGRLISLYRERATSLNDFIEITKVYIDGASERDEKIIRKKWSDEMQKAFELLVVKLREAKPYDADGFESVIKPFIQENNLKFGDTLQLLRTAVSGSPQGPDVYAMLALLGWDEVAARVEKAITDFATI